MKRYIICKRNKDGNIACIRDYGYSGYNWHFSFPMSHGLATVFDTPPVDLAKKFKGFIVKADSPKCPVHVFNTPRNPGKNFNFKKK